MNSQIRQILEELSSESSNYNWQSTDYDKLVDQAEKALVDYFIELIGEDRKPTVHPHTVGSGLCYGCDEVSENIAYNKRNAELRAKLKGGQE